MFIIIRIIGYDIFNIIFVCLADARFTWKQIEENKANGLPYDYNISRLQLETVAKFTTSFRKIADVFINVQKGRGNSEATIKHYQQSIRKLAKFFCWLSADDIDYTSTYTYTANVNTTRGAYRRFIITPIGTKAGYDGNSITSVSVRTNRLPATPTILAPSGNYATANAEPRIRFSISAEPDGQEQTIEYSVDDGEFKELLKVPAIGGIFVGSIEEVSQGAHTIKLRAFDGLARSEETTNVEFSHNPFTALANPSTP